MAAIQGPKPEAEHEVSGGRKPAASKGPVDGGDVGSGIGSSNTGNGTTQTIEGREGKASRTRPGRSAELKIVATTST
jgi:hypothetical protein